MTSKIPVFSPSCIILAVICAFMVNNILISSVDSAPTYKEMEVIDDLPVKVNLEKYLLSLEKIIYFVNSHRLYVDLNLNFGIFLTNVNLRTTLQMRGHRLTAQKRVRMERLLKTNDEIEKYFFKMVRKYLERMDPNDESPVGRSNYVKGTVVNLSSVKLDEAIINVLAKVTNLFTNETSWPNHLRNFNIELLKKTRFYSRKELETMYFKWPAYKAKVYSYYNNTFPNPSDSDVCLDLLSQNPTNDKPKLVHCQVPYVCAKIVLNGTHYGYGMTHRILFLILSRFSRGCALLTPSEDRDLLDSLCAGAYNEAEFMAYHDFETTDLLMEIMSLCSLEGHAQFLRRSWIDEAIDYQTSLGCFNLTRPGSDDEIKPNPSYESFSWQFTITDLSIMGGSCNVHATAVAAAMLSAAIRYILENYY